MAEMTKQERMLKLFKYLKERFPSDRPDLETEDEEELAEVEDEEVEETSIMPVRADNIEKARQVKRSFMKR